ncbi:hypothetical protein [Sphingomonas sp. LHG3406-1]|uniref:hypothetical protein n=1 Tax=Sphingomonas sp. LHG3406-1 TaxID=2804617 RepID=UPI00261BB697|nr:hypothetical protein [Sphingomonas sp. LHG3406-1]
MRQWLFLTSGMLLWTAHFFGVYIAGSLFPGSVVADWLTIILTIAGLLAAMILARFAWKAWRTSSTDEVRHWISGIALMGDALAGIAILYQGLPALLL